MSDNFQKILRVILCSVKWVGNKVGNVDWDNPDLGTRRDCEICMASFTIVMEKDKGEVLADSINTVKESNSMFNIPWACSM